MKKLAIILALGAAACAGSFYAGLRYGEFNGRIESAAMDTGPLMNLLLIEAGKKKELSEMNRGQPKQGQVLGLGVVQSDTAGFQYFTRLARRCANSARRRAQNRLSVQLPPAGKSAPFCP